MTQWWSISSSTMKQTFKESKEPAMTCPELPAASGWAPKFPFWSLQLRTVEREGWAEFVQQLVWGDGPGSLRSPGSRRLAMPAWSELLCLSANRSLEKGAQHMLGVSSLGAISNADTKKVPGSLFSARSQDCSLSNLLGRACKNPFPRRPTGEEVLCSGGFVQACALGRCHGWVGSR